MKPKPPLSADAAALRRRAEASLREQHPEAGPVRTEADTRRLLHELQVHQIELEMQNGELQQARDQAELESEKYSDLYDFAPVGYLTLDREGTICAVNLTGASLLGIERSRLVQRRFGLFVSVAGLSEFNGFLKRVFASKAREACEVSLLQEGKPPVEVRMEAVLVASGRECRAVVRDITELKRAEANRLILNKLESTGILAGGIAHDFNNLFSVMLMNLELGRLVAPAGEELAQCLEQAKRATLLARGLTQQLITFAQGGVPLRRPTALSAVIQESTRLALSGSRVRCDFFLADNLWLAEVDAGQIGQVIRNIIQNAREAMPAGGVVSVRGENLVPGSPEETALPAGDCVRVSIADRGGGIAPEVLPKIFDPYFSTKQRGEQKGMGLGLTICHSIIQKHGGAIHVESVPRVGTTFHLYLPAARKLPAPEPTPLPMAPPWRGRILLMDDKEAIRKVVGASLQRQGHEVELAEEGRQAVEVFSRAQTLGRPFDAVILDLTVRAGMGGEEAIQALLKMDPTVKAIVISGYFNDPVMLEYERHGFKDALVKPFEIGQLQETLARIMGRQPNDQATP